MAGRATFSAALRSARERQGLTQERLALAADMDRSFLVELENGQHSCTLDRVFDLASALGVPAASLLES
jgi:transcriptional regulator with XRE-family HTH domain